jgi:outer membrane protein TolC
VKTTHIIFFYLVFLPGLVLGAPMEKILTIDELIFRAMTVSDRAMAAEAELAAASAGHKSARADFFPKVDAVYSVTHLSEDPVSKMGGTQMPVGHDTTHTWAVAVTQPLFTGFSLSAIGKIAELDVGIRKQEGIRTRQTVVRDVKNFAYAVLLAEKLRKVAQAEVAALRAHEEDAKQFYKEGLIPLNDVLKSQVALAEAMQKEERAKADLKLARIRLGLMLKLPDSDAIRIQDPGAIDIPFSQCPDLMDQALVSRPELAMRRMGREQFTESVNVAKSRFYPQVNLVAAYEETGEEPGVRRNDYANRYNSRVGIHASWNFFEWGKTRYDMEKARQIRAAEEARIRQEEDRIRLEVREAYLDLTVSKANIRTAKEALTQARENWRITELQYQQQLATSTDVLNARGFLTQADTNYFQAFYGHLSALAELDYALGEGKE